MAKARKKMAGTVSESPVGTMPEASPSTVPKSGSEMRSAPQKAGDTTAATPDRNRVAMRAYELYLARGGGDGAALDDWLTAERELNTQDPDRTDE